MIVILKERSGVKSLVQRHNREKVFFYLCRRWCFSLTKLFKTTALLLNDQVKSCPQVHCQYYFSMAFFFIIIVVHILHLITSWKTLPALQSATHPLAFPNHALHLSCPTPICSLVPLYLHLSPLAGSIPICPVMGSSSIWHPDPAHQSPTRSS